MKLLLLLFTFISYQLAAQCSLVTTGMGSTVDCYGDCDGTITYAYQNTNPGNPGSPYIVSIYNQTSNTWVSTTTYINEIETIQFSNLCAGDYSINVQGNSCSDITYVTVSQPSPLQINVNTVDLFQGNNGSATIYAGGGTPPYMYSIDGGTNYQGGNSFSGLAAGAYLATVMDDNGCTINYQFVLNDIGNCNMVVTAQGGQSSCNNYCDAMVQFAFTGTYLNGPFEIELQNANGQTVQTLTGNSMYSGAFQNVCAGNYTVIVTDANGCTGSYQTVVTNSSPPQITNVTTTVSAWGTSTGTATVNITGGTAPFTYSLDNGATWQTSNVFNGLAAGFYIVYAEDANGCSTIFCFIVEETVACTMTLNSTATSAGCFGANTGSISYVYGNGSGPVTIVLEDINTGIVQSLTNANGTSQGVFNNVSAGTYYVIVTDAAGCTVTNTVSVTGATAPIYVTATTTPVTSGSANGTITAIASGGTAPYQYSLDGITYQASNVFTGLTTGVYIVYVQDANGCTAVQTVQLTQVSNCNQIIVPSASPVSCNGSNDGSVFYNFTSDGSGAPYSVSLMSGNTVLQTATFSIAGGAGTFNNLSAGAYTIVLAGSNGCVTTVQFYVDEPDPIVISNVSLTDASPATADGSAIVTLTGGTAPFTYTLNNGTPQASNVFIGLSAGVQILEVEDANGCVAIYCFIVNEGTGCQPLGISASLGLPISCYGSCNGVINWVYTSGGTPGTYVVTLNENGNTVATQTFGQSAFQGAFPNLCPGTYSVTVTDPAGCSETVNYTLVEPELIVITPTLVSATAGSSNGSITVNATGGTGQYEYSLDAFNWQSSNVFSGLAAGGYVVYVKDANGCIQLMTLLLDESTICNLLVTANPTMVYGCGNACNGAIQYAYASTNGTGPFTVVLQDQNGNTWSETQTGLTASGTFTNLCPGVYIVVVTDANGCSGVYTVQLTGPSNITVVVNQTDPTFGLSDGSFTINSTGGQPSYEYSIDNQATWTNNNTFSGLSAGVYATYIKDTEQCTQVVSVKLGQSTASISEADFAYSVYPNPTNGQLFIIGDGMEKPVIYQLDGSIVYTVIQQTTQGWFADLSSASAGVYLVHLQVNGVTRVERIVVY